MQNPTPRFLSLRFRLFTILPAVAAVITFTHISAAIPDDSVQALKNRPELSLPIATEKRVIAHNMTAIIRFQNHELEDSCDPEYYSPKGNITEDLGGMVQVRPMVSDYLSTASLDEAVEFELKAAKKLGIDGFQFYYTLRKRGPDDEIITAYFRAAERLGLDFKFTFCPSHPMGPNEDLKVHDFAKRINRIMDEVGRDNPHWLRTPDGRLIMYLWYGEQLANIPENASESNAYYVARAWNKLSRAIGEDVAYIFTINHDISDAELNDYLDYFPATWIWTLPYNEAYIGKRVANTCKERHRTFTGSTFASFYTSKLLPPGTWDMFHFARDAAKAGMGHVERRGIITGLSLNFRKLLEFAIEEDVPLINIITWNDYPEGHHLAPEINHNYGFSILLQHYKSIWKGEPSPFEGKDVAISFFKKYRHDIAPDPYNIPIVYLSEAVPEAAEDVIEVVTLLKEQADVTVNGETKSVPRGLVSSDFPYSTGPVSVAVQRGDETTVRFETPECITDHPYRTDRMIYSFSSEFMQFHKALFGDYPPVYSTEYRTTPYQP